MADLTADCERLRSLHVPGEPLLLPNAWDAATAGAVADAGFPVVATTSAGVAAALGFEDHQGAPAGEMLAAAARIAAAVEIPVTVDAEAGYRMRPAELVAALRDAGAAGCNLEDTDHSTEQLRDPSRHAAWLGEVRAAADALGYPLVVNARIDVFLAHLGEEEGQERLVGEALERARAYLDAGADCVFPILLWERPALEQFVSGAGGPVNALALPNAPPRAALAELGVSRISYGLLLHRRSMERFAEELSSIGP
jgi:2-methylisocitrate lyase-like PEP mutase family enzyme